MKYILALLLWSTLVYADDFDLDYICEPVYKINLNETTGKPSNPTYIPLFEEAQIRMNRVDPSRSIEDLCGIIYDCGNRFRLPDGNIEFKDCQLEDYKMEEY